MPNYVMDQLQIQLLDQGIINLNEVIDVPTYAYVREAISRLEAEGSPEVTVKITSPGGDLFIALSIYDLLRLYQGKVTGIVLMGASSGAAAVVLQGCDQRLCAKHATLMIHHARQSLQLEDLTDEKLQATRQSFNTQENPMEKILCTKTGKTPEEIRAFCLKEKEMDAEEAKAFGLIDDILET